MVESESLEGGVGVDVVVVDVVEVDDVVVDVDLPLVGTAGGGVINGKCMVVVATPGPSLNTFNKYVNTVSY